MEHYWPYFWPCWKEAGEGLWASLYKIYSSVGLHSHSALISDPSWPATSPGSSFYGKCPVHVHHFLTFRQKCLTMHFSERIPIVQWHMTTELHCQYLLHTFLSLPRVYIIALNKQTKNTMVIFVWFSESRKFLLLLYLMALRYILSQSINHLNSKFSTIWLGS